MTQQLEPARSGIAGRSNAAELLDTAVAQIADRILFVAGVCGVKAQDVIDAVKRRIDGQR